MTKRPAVRVGVTPPGPGHVPLAFQVVRPSGQGPLGVRGGIPIDAADGGPPTLTFQDGVGT